MAIHDLTYVSVVVSLGLRPVTRFDMRGPHGSDSASKAGVMLCHSRFNLLQYLVGSRRKPDAALLVPM